MMFLWEALLCARMAQIPEQELRFVHARHGSPYMELSLPCLNQPWLDKDVEVNTYDRFYSIFKAMFPPDPPEFPALRDSLTDAAVHMLAQNDIMRGMTREDYHKKLLADEVMRGGFGETAVKVFCDMDKKEQEKLLSGWLNSFRVGSALPIFLDMVHGLIDDSIVYLSRENPDEILLYTGLKKEQKLEQRIAFLADTFLDIRYHVEVFYEHHFGIIDIGETMRIDETAIC